MSWFTDKITEPIQEIIVETFNAMVMDTAIAFVDAISGMLLNEAMLLSFVFNLPFLKSTVLIVQGIAILILIARATLNVLQSMANQQPIGTVLKDVFVSIIMIAVGPWLLSLIYYFVIHLTTIVMNLPFDASYSSLSEILVKGLSPFNVILAAIAIMVSVIFLFVVLFSISLRIGLVALILVTFPFSYAFGNQIGANWLKSAWQNFLAIPLQMFLYRFSMVILIIPEMDILVKFLFFIGILGAAIKAPAVIKENTTDTGAGSVLGGTAGQVTQFAILSRVFKR